jgi:hypothetical protein
MKEMLRRESRISSLLLRAGKPVLRQAALSIKVQLQPVGEEAEERAVLQLEALPALRPRKLKAPIILRPPGLLISPRLSR